MSFPKRIIIDTDPGIDDAMAILWAFLSPDKVDVLGLTTVFGNSHTWQTTENALKILALLGRTDVPVARGAEGPLLRPFEHFAWRVHGVNGLGDVALDDPPTTQQPDPRRAAQFIVDTVMSNPADDITLVTLGPLTNLALAVALEPRIAARVHEVVIMGGAAHGRGNASATAEANIRNDPEAAQMVLQAPWTKLTMVGLDVSMQTIMTPAYVQTLTTSTTTPSSSASDSNNTNKYTDFIGKILPYYIQFYKDYSNLEGLFVHDSSALAYVMDPTLFTARHVYVHVETQSSVTAGQTVVDFRHRTDATHAPNAYVCVAVDSERLLQMYQERLKEGGI